MVPSPRGGRAVARADSPNTTGGQQQDGRNKHRNGQGELISGSMECRPNLAHTSLFTNPKLFEDGLPPTQWLVNGLQRQEERHASSLGRLKSNASQNPCEEMERVQTVLRLEHHIDKVRKALDAASGLEGISTDRSRHLRGPLPWEHDCERKQLDDIDGYYTTKWTKGASGMGYDVVEPQTTQSPLRQDTTHSKFQPRAPCGKPSEPTKGWETMDYQVTSESGDIRA
ncbi:unnamed protein product, partial [Prorocentrum cordatum]